MPVDLRRVGCVRTRRDDEDAGDFVRRLVQRNAILERVHDSFGGAQSDDFVERRMLETEIHESDAASVAGGNAGNVPGRFCRPRHIVGERHERNQRRIVYERRNEMPEPRKRQLARRERRRNRVHCPGW